MSSDLRREEGPILTAWAREGLGKELTPEHLLALAQVAAWAREAPRQWRAGDTIPDEVSEVVSTGDLVWARDSSGWRVTGGPTLPEDALLLLGPVREYPDPDGAAIAFLRGDAPDVAVPLGGNGVTRHGGDPITALENAMTVLHDVADREGRVVSRTVVNHCLRAERLCREALAAVRARIMRGDDQEPGASRV